MKMKAKLEKGDKVKLLSTIELMKVLKRRNFCSDDITRQKIADKIGGKEGMISNIEDKYAFDYFYFILSEEPYSSYSIPYESVDFTYSSEMQKPILVDQFADNGEFSHWHLVNPNTGEVLWSSFPEETKARGEKIVPY